jgi:hypothetical protein
MELEGPMSLVAESQSVQKAEMVVVALDPMIAVFPDEQFLSEALIFHSVDFRQVESPHCFPQM